MALDDRLSELEAIIKALQFTDCQSEAAQKSLDRARLLLAQARLELQHVRQLLV